METNDNQHMPPHQTVQEPPVVSGDKPTVSHAPIIKSSLEAKKKPVGVGAALAIVVIIGLAVLGLYYLAESYQGLTYTPDVLPTITEVQNSDDPTIQAYLAQSTDDDLLSIESDGGTTDFSEIDAALRDLDASLVQ